MSIRVTKFILAVSVCAVVVHCAKNVVSVQSDAGYGVTEVAAYEIIGLDN